MEQTGSAEPRGRLKLSTQDALGFVQSRRPAVAPNFGFLMQLHEFASKLSRADPDSRAALALSKGTGGFHTVDFQCFIKCICSG